MYIRPIHACLDEEILRKFIKENPLGLLTTSIPSSQFHKIQTSHIPFVLDDPIQQSDGKEKDLGALRGHLARANPQAKAIVEHLKSSRQERQSEGGIGLGDGDGEILEEEVLILFNSQHHYISPKYYQETKPSNGKVVPTWNYSAVQIYGKAKIYHDSNSAATSDYLNRQISDLSDSREDELIKMKEKKELNSLSNELENSTSSDLGKGKERERGRGWRVSDAPSKYIEILKKAIIGIEVEIISIEGRFKLSQEMGEKDRQGVVEGLKSLGTEASNGIATGVENGGFYH